MATAWVLNLDAEDELRHGRVYTAPDAVRAQVRARAPAAWAALAGPGDVLVDLERPERGAAEGLEGDAWCPTPRALAALARAGARIPAAPALEVLRAVNDRAFSAGLGQCLEGACFARTEEDVLGAVRGGAWLLKRAFGYAGRGQRVLEAGRVADSDVAWIRGALAGGLGVQVEPFVRVEREFAVHGRLTPDGGFALRGIAAQRADASRAWTSSAHAGGADLTPDERAQLTSEAERVAEALARAGYHGPFGVDALRYTDPRGRPRLNPRSEINARYTMGWRASGSP